MTANKGFLSALGRWFGLGREALSEAEEKALRDKHKARCHNFKLLLAANNSALEIMTDMEEALKGASPFGKTFVRNKCVRVSSNVYQIIKHLNELSDGKYSALFDSYRKIQKSVNAIVHAKSEKGGGPLVLPLSQVGTAQVDEVGGKVANLGEVAARLGLSIPPGFVVTASGYHRFMEFNDLQAEVDRMIQSADAQKLDEMYSLSSAVQQALIRAPLPPDLEGEILQAYARLKAELGREPKLVMRSSALGEDLLETSFAGQYRSEINVAYDSVLQTYKEIVASKYGVAAMTYRFNRGVPDEDVAMCVGCMNMIEARSGGVVYTRNPLNIRDDALIVNSVPGLPKSVVDGSVDSDLFIIARDGGLAVKRKTIANKKAMFVPDPHEGVARVELSGPEAGLASLDEDQALELAGIAVRIEDYYSQPQDVEWALDEQGKFRILQCRPLQQWKGGEEKGVELEEDDPESLLLKGGVTASPGAAVGRPYFLNRDMDALGCPEGAVVVAAQALPRWATLLHRAAAMITEHGSVAGHLGNVAREFGTPAIFGLQGAMAGLKDAESVTVDADGRRVYQGRIEKLLEKIPPPRNLMEGSPVYNELSQAAGHIIPLNLLDPDAEEFRPENCRTLHDITRFSHEKSVHEMFRRGQESDFPDSASKQLFHEVAMQYWIINLDDGFQGEVGEKFVLLENIASIPMLALWKGMTARPISGPPPVDAKGFMSVLLEATTNPDLDPAVSSSFAMRNYFMISRTFCSLQSRFGFHFCTVEALIGDRDEESYLSFQFKGGAANLERRVGRARFVAEILEGIGFRIEIKQDALFARMEGYPRPFMESRLSALGYLIIHTRQLDMVMSNPEAVADRHYMITTDLAELLQVQ